MQCICYRCWPKILSYGSSYILGTFTSKHLAVILVFYVVPCNFDIASRLIDRVDWIQYTAWEGPLGRCRAIYSSARDHHSFAAAVGRH